MSCTIAVMRMSLTLVGVLLVLGLASPTAQAATPTALQVTAPVGYADTSAPVEAALIDGAGAPVAGVVVVAERQLGGEWTALTSGATDADGRFAFAAVRARRAADNRLRISYAGDETHAPATAVLDLPLRQRASRAAIDGPPTVVLGRSVELSLTWRTASGIPVGGAVRLLQRTGAAKWVQDRVVRTGADGRARWRVEPTASTRWRAIVDATDWTRATRSDVQVLTVVPPMPPVNLPGAAPRPRAAVPSQPAGVGKGAHPVTTRVPDTVWRQMDGVSWHEGCPIGRNGLRLLRINYWGYDGFRHRGMLVAATGAVSSMAGALGSMYRGGLPIRSMYLVDRFGYSAELRGGNDYRSMAAGNTSAFNCRWVVNRPGVRSPHSYGRALDLNTWENPYRSATGLVPNTWWQSHSHALVAWRSSRHRVVRTLARHGLRWTYGLGDTQHFDVTRSDGRLVSDPACAGVVCE